MLQESKAWIFVSHSVRDLEQVRNIRNELERRGAEPLLFFLKALGEAEELRILLTREIEARTFFLLCDSVNARDSTWVQEEHKYAKKLPGKRVISIDLASNWPDQVSALDEMLRVSTVFMSFAMADLPEIVPFITFLRDHDFAVWTPDAGQDWQATIKDALTKAAEQGYLVAFLSTASLRSQWVKAEIDAFLAISKVGTRLILIDLEPVDHLVPIELQALQRLRFHAHDDATNRKMLLQALGLS